MKLPCSFFSYSNLSYIWSESRPRNANHCGIVSMAVPTMPSKTAMISMTVSLSLMNTKAIMAEKIGPVVKLMQLAIVSGM